MSKFKKIVLTGGPCAGKSSAKSYIEDMCTAHGWHLMWIEEAATQLLAEGFLPGDTVSEEAFQAANISRQMLAEKSAELACHMSSHEMTLIICDRGVKDGAAYLPEPFFSDMLGRLGMDIAEAVASYDAVLHLTTAANGAEHAYQWKGSETCNNPVRRENVEEAREKDELTKRVWQEAEPKRWIEIDNAGDFEHKMLRTVSAIEQIVNE